MSLPWPRIIAHLDVDAFFASVEEQRDPSLRDVPLIVCGSGPRAVVTTANYHARKYGVHSAMSGVRARRLCPHGRFVAPNMSAYRDVSQRLWTLAREQLNILQLMGLDEAYADMSACPDPEALLRDLVADIRRQTGMTVSVGLSENRLAAKVCSDADKPHGFVMLSRADCAEKFAGSSVRILQGVGPKTQDRLQRLGVVTVGHLQHESTVLLAEKFGSRWARELHDKAYFRDGSPVTVSRRRVSRSVEDTFIADIGDRDELARILGELAVKLAVQMADRDEAGRTISIKVRLDDFTTVTRARTLPQRTADPQLITEVAQDLLNIYDPQQPVRLLGVRVAGLDDPDPQQQPPDVVTATKASEQPAPVQLQFEWS